METSRSYRIISRMSLDERSNHRRRPKSDFKILYSYRDSSLNLAIYCWDTKNDHRHGVCLHSSGEFFLCFQMNI